MKKLILFCIGMLMSMAMLMADNTSSAIAKSSEKAISSVTSAGEKAISAVYSDGVSAIDTVYHDGKSIIKTVYSDGKEFLSNTYPEVKEAIIAIAKAVGCAAEHVYIVLVKKYFVEGCTQAIFCVFGLVLLVIGWYKLEQYIKKKSGVELIVTDEHQHTVYKDLKLDWRVLYPVSVIVASIIILANIPYTEMMVNLLNPEWNAINYIVEFTKAMIH